MLTGTGRTFAAIGVVAVAAGIALRYPALLAIGIAFLGCLVIGLAWVLRRKEVTSALIGVRTLEQLKDCLGAIDTLDFTDKELAAIDAATADARLDSHPPLTLPD